MVDPVPVQQLSVEEARERLYDHIQRNGMQAIGWPVDALIEAVRREQDGLAARALRNLLAVIHRDGGHRTAEFATLTEAAADGERIVIETRVELERRVLAGGEQDGDHHQVGSKG